MLRNTLLTALAACALCAPAQANVTYTLVDQTITPLFDASQDPRNATPPSFTLELTDAALTRGTFALQLNAGAQPESPSGDVADLVLFTYRAGNSATGSFSSKPTTYLNSTISLILSTTTARGFITVGDGQLDVGFDIGSNRNGGWSGTFGAQNSPCGGDFGCKLDSAQVTASVSAVPEPATFALLALPVGLAIKRRWTGTVYLGRGRLAGEVAAG